MNSFNVRQLKNNPSEALRSCENGPVLILKGDKPEALLLHLNPDEFPDSPALKLALVSSLYKDGVVSLGRAARIAEVSVADLISHLSRLGMSVAQATGQDAKQDLESLDAWLASS